MDAFSFEPDGPERGIEAAARLLITRRRILVFTGAGISTESGIPDFRGPDGIWTKVDPAEFTYSRFMANPETRRRSWQMRLHSGILEAEPNIAHRALVELWDTGRMLAVVTQNIDGLHQQAGLPSEAVIELHGNAHQAVCVDCGDKTPTNAVMERIDGGDHDPSCLECGGIIKTDVVMFEEPMPVLETNEAMHLAFECDAVLVIGSTLGVYPAAYIPIRAIETGAPLIIVNLGATDMDELATVLVDGPAGQTVPELVKAVVKEHSP